jgi:hypothetical protein
MPDKAQKKEDAFASSFRFLLLKKLLLDSYVLCSLCRVDVEPGAHCR